MYFKYLITSLLFASSVICFSQSINILEKEFVSDSLKRDNITAFEERAVQKLKDYANYIEIISDKTYDYEFRLQAFDMAIKLFANQYIIIKDSILTLNGGKKYDVKSFMLKILSSDNKKITISLSDIHFSEPLKYKSKGIYEGKINFKENVSFISKNNISETKKQYNKTVRIVLTKINKDFGANKKSSVWDVALGQIN